MRRSRSIVLMIVLASTMAVATPGLAKRAAPPVAQPLTLGGVTYVATHSTAPASGKPTSFIAKVEAHDPAGNKLLWDVEVYRIRYQPDLETDVQDIWIASLAAQGSDVLVTDERGQRYLVEVATRTAHRLP